MKWSPLLLDRVSLAYQFGKFFVRFKGTVALLHISGPTEVQRVATCYICLKYLLVPLHYIWAKDHSDFIKLRLNRISGYANEGYGTSDSVLAITTRHLELVTLFVL